MTSIRTIATTRRSPTPGAVRLLQVQVDQYDRHVVIAPGIIRSTDQSTTDLLWTASLVHNRPYAGLVDHIPEAVAAEQKAVARPEQTRGNINLQILGLSDRSIEYIPLWMDRCFR